MIIAAVSAAMRRQQRMNDGIYTAFAQTTTPVYVVQEQAAYQPGYQPAYQPSNQPPNQPVYQPLYQPYQPR